MSLNGKTHKENGSIIEFSSNKLLKEDLIAVKCTRYLVEYILHHLFTLVI